MSINSLPASLVEATKKVLEGSAEYQAFFKKALKKFGVDSPAELGDKKKEFFNYVDKNYKGKDEEVEEAKDKHLKKHAKAFSKGPKGRFSQKKTMNFRKKEEVEEEHVDEWIKADGTRRRVAEKDQRKVKVEDVVRDMWQNADINGLPTTLEGATTPVGKYQTPELREESLSEGVKKSKLKIDSKILKDLKKLEKDEKGMNDKEVKWVHDFFKKGVEVVSDDGEPSNISDKALKQFDKMWGKMDTFVRDEIYGIMKKHSDEQLSAVLGPYGA
tara:strand:- start:185 stop:1000 length:816 start_codon:yes stop_codon:yes gene_type:complete